MTEIVSFNTTRLMGLDSLSNKPDTSSGAPAMRPGKGAGSAPAF